MCDFIAEEYDIDICEVSISRLLEREKISRKKVNAIHNVFLLSLVTKGCKRTFELPSGRVVGASDRVGLRAVDVC
jgi:hypothetical protein